MRADAGERSITRVMTGFFLVASCGLSIGFSSGLLFDGEQWRGFVLEVRFKAAFDRYRQQVCTPLIIGRKTEFTIHVEVGFDLHAPGGPGLFRTLQQVGYVTILVRLLIQSDG